MIIELICMPIFFIINSAINTIPLAFKLPNWLADVLGLLIKAMQFFPLDVWVIVIGNILFWLVLHFVWAVIEWVYKKIPGVN